MRVLIIGAEQPRPWGSALAEAAQVRRTADAGTARDLAQSWRPDVLLADLGARDGNLAPLVRTLRADVPAAAVVVLVTAPAVELVVALMRAGAADVIDAATACETGLTSAVLAAGGRASGARGGRDADERGRLIARSRAMREVLGLVDTVAGSDANILIEGESGTGKEVVADAIHTRSRRAGLPFVKINCAAIPRDLIEAELFGYRRGAFTDAGDDREGLLAAANGGSLLLDEIGEMPAGLQVKLLRVLQERAFRPLGAEQVVRADFRLICATNLEASAAVRAGQLREDLYFRINTITIRVPSLRERAEDVPALCEHFLATYSRRHGRDAPALGPEAARLLARYRWPGNVRELEHAIERAVLVAKGAEVTPDDLPDAVRNGHVPAGLPVPAAGFRMPVDRTLAEIERMAILQTLERTSWNKQEAAQILGLYRPTLYAKMKRHGILEPARTDGPRQGEPS